jgi:hypothetical protein
MFGLIAWIKQDSQNLILKQCEAITLLLHPLPPFSASTIVSLTVDFFWKEWAP